eukprot:GEMP01029463.1.p1 GENE.GEMP01029463.1~~GEMP01029463.1.p1  ORF type:complete len:162 (+),score=34.54 GEMP01029463.1:90-575(+)
MKVQLYVYDISKGYAKMMSRILLGKQVDVIPHSGIVVHEKTEYYFGGGVCVGEAGDCIDMKPVEIIDLGESTKTEVELREWLREQRSEWTEEKYDFLDRNCNHFANAICQFLGVREIPSRIVNVAGESLSGNRGNFIRQALESFQAAQVKNNASLNPFGNK